MAVSEILRPVETSQFVLTTHYNVSITSQPAKNI